MNLSQLSLRERRIVALGLLFAFLLVFIFALLAPYLSRYGHYLSAIDDQSFRLERLQTAAAQLPELTAEVEAVRTQALMRGYLLEEATPSLAAANIQEQLARLVDRHGGEVRSMQVGRVQDENGFQRVSVNVSMAASTEALAELFADLESRRPLLFIDNVVIRLARARTRTGADQQTSGQLEVDFDVSAYMQGTGN